MTVVRQPEPFRRVDRSVEIGDERRRRVTLLERGGVDERLERRTGLTMGLRDAIELALAKAPSADERANLARGRVKRDERALQVVGRFVVLRQPRPCRERDT